MSSQTAQLLEAFEALPEDEKRVFTVEFLRRAVPFDSGSLDDAEIADASDQLLASVRRCGSRVGHDCSSYDQPA